MFRGLYTAIITPFNTDGSIDLGKLKELVELQVQGGATGIVPVGTTGESPTLSHEEHCIVMAATVAASAGRVQVIAGAGSNSTREAIALTHKAIDVGADATLQITPYYNKPNQEGLVRHFTALADLGHPVVLYNVPGRTGREIEVGTVAKLAQHPSIVALKEAGGSVDRVNEILTRCDIAILSGDDSLTFPMMAVGAGGGHVACRVAHCPTLPGALFCILFAYSLVNEYAPREAIMLPHVWALRTLHTFHTCLRLLGVKITTSMRRRHPPAP